MVVRHHEDLRAYQLSRALRDEVGAIFARPGFKSDSRFRDDFRAALDSGPNNIAEGFWRYSHPEFARFTVIARGSLGECLSHLDRARQSRYITDDEYQRFRRLAEHALKSVTKLLSHLKRTPTPTRT
jgi:four helix bundle protein